MFNVFDAVADNVFDGLNRYRNMFIEAGADFVHVAGSGPVIFAPVENSRKAEEIHRRIDNLGLLSFVVASTNA